MSLHPSFFLPILLLLFFLCSGCTMTGTSSTPRTSSALGPFTNHQDIGTPSTPAPGSASYDPSAKKLTITGGGANVWAKEDDMHFVWKKQSGDATLAADIDWSPETPGVVAHRKAMLMIRQSLDTDSSYADATLHGNGNTALQWRDGKGEISYEVIANADRPKRLRIEKRCSYFSMSVGSSDADMKPAGGAIKVDWPGDYYIGIGVCSHSKDRVETATFSNIDLAVPPTGPTKLMVNTLQTFTLSNRDRKVVWVDTHPVSPANRARFEAPNWARDDSNLLYFNYGGRLYKIPAILASSNPSTPAEMKVAPEVVDLGILTNLNNDHVISFDNQMIGVSDQSQGNRQSTIWTIPLKGGTPKKITENTPSYFHGWSRDGKTLVYAAPRGNPQNWDIYSISSDGGPETRLTTTTGREDGPEFSPDGQYIYFNSDRTGKMQIWRMRPDGSNQEQVFTDDKHHCWFPHISPNGQQMTFIAFDLSVASGDHPESKDVALYVMNLNTKAITLAAKLFGGQGTINVPSWAPNSQAFAFVSYQIIESK